MTIEDVPDEVVLALDAEMQKHAIYMDRVTIAKLLASECPFDRVENNLEPEDPCPVCGDLGTFVDDAPPSRCVSRPAAIRALD